MAQYTEYHPLKFWLDPASIAEIVAHIQTYLVSNPINSTTEIETIIHDYLIAHPELIGGVDSVNGQTGEVVLTANNISGGENVTIKDVLDSLQDQIDDIVASIPSDYQQLIDDVSDLKGAVDILFDPLTGDKIEQITKYRSDLTAGILGKNGNVISSTTAGYFTTPIPVNPGETITVKKGYLDSANNITGIINWEFRACAYFTDNTYTFANKGFDTKASTITVPDDIHYIQPSISGIMTGTYTVVIINRTTAHGQVNQILLDLMDGNLSTKNLKNNYACALPITTFRMTVGLPEKWYKKSMVTPPTDYVIASAGYSTTYHYNDGEYFPNESAISSVNGYRWEYYDSFLVKIDEFLGDTGIGVARRVLAENLSDCTLLAIGDSTVDHDDMTAKLLSYFADKNKTITLLGILGSQSDPLNKNEGRAGWTTGDYLANTTKNGYNNPFFNPTTEAFDFEFYMQQQGYTDVDFVVIQLGINDLYPSSTFGTPVAKETIWANIKVMIDSILAYNSNNNKNAKILLNLPTTPNSDANKHRVPEFTYRSNVVTYNAYALAHAKAEYDASNVRCSYCHLILDPATEIRDNVHPTTAGYEKMGLEIINQINVWQNGY